MDARWYHAVAVSLAAGHGFSFIGDLTAYRPPGYPFLLSLTYRLLGSNFYWAWIWGGVSTAIVILTTYYIAQRQYGAVVARLATIAIAVYPALVLQTGQAMSDLAFLAGLLLLVSFILSSFPPRLLHVAIIGIALGLLTLTRGVAIALVGIVPVIWLIQRMEIKRLVTASVVLGLIFVISLTPWMLRNYSVFGRFTLGTNTGINAYIGNNPRATGGYDLDAPRLARERHLNESELDQVLLREVVAFVSTHPVDAFLLLPGKFANLYLLETSAATSFFQGQRTYSSLKKYTLYGVTQFCYLALLILFCFRVLDLFTATNRPQGIQWVGWILVSYFTFLALIFFGTDRFRLPILPWMLIESSVFLFRTVARSGIAKGVPEGTEKAG